MSFDDIVKKKLAKHGARIATLSAITSSTHAQNTDTDLDATFEATFVKKVDNVAVLADITSAGADIEDAVTKKHDRQHAIDAAADHTGQGDIVTHDASEFLGAAAKAADSNLLDAKDSTYFASSVQKLDDFGAPDNNTDLNVSTSAHGLCPVLNNNDATWLDGKGAWTAPTAAEVGALAVAAKAADSDLLDGHDSTYFATSAHKLTHATGGTDALDAYFAETSHTHTGVYLAAAGKAADSDLLDGHDSLYFATSKHYLTHVASGSDDITGYFASTKQKIDDFSAGDDNTDLDVSTTAHGLCPKITNTANFLKGDGTWTAVAGTGDVVGPAGAVADNIAYFDGTTGKLIKDSGKTAADFLAVAGKAADSTLFDGQNIGYFAETVHDHDADYLGINAKADDADLLDGHNSTYFATSAHKLTHAVGGTDALGDYFAETLHAVTHAPGGTAALSYFATTLQVAEIIDGVDFTGASTAADHGTAATDQIVNVCYGTGDPPAANTTTEGALYVKYTA